MSDQPTGDTDQATTIRRLSNELLTARRERDEAVDLLDTIVAAYRTLQKAYRILQEAEANGRRAPGRPPLTEQEIAHVLARADQVKAEIEAQKRTPTQQEIAAAIGLAPKTIKRYRDRVDNKGQK